jgi:RimJ/RimL family protein N-acetyltransferase
VRNESAKLNVEKIFTERLELINSTEEILVCALEGDHALAAKLKISIPEQWTEFGRAPFQYALDKIKEKQGDSRWWSWLPILKSEQMLVGNCGYKGPPQGGVVEIGYEVAEQYRGIGLATEMANALIQQAKSFPEVTMILAHTLAEENASVAILKKCGFTFKGSVEDPDDGIIWRWELPA